MVAAMKHKEKPTNIDLYEGTSAKVGIFWLFFEFSTTKNTFNHE